MEEITAGLKICPKCRHLMIVKDGTVRCPKCDRKEMEQELKETTKKVGDGIIRRPLKKKKEVIHTDPFEHCNKVYLMFHAKSEEYPYRKADVMTFPLDTPITEIDQKCKEWAGKGIGSWVLLCIA